MRKEGSLIGSHYYFIETNPRPSFNRIRAYGERLDIPAGTKLVTYLVKAWRTEETITNLVQKGLGHTVGPFKAVYAPRPIVVPSLTSNWLGSR